MSHGKLRVLYANGTWHKDNTTGQRTSHTGKRWEGAVKERKREVKPFANAGPVYDRAWSSLGEVQGSRRCPNRESLKEHKCQFGHLRNSRRRAEPNQFVQGRTSDFARPSVALKGYSTRLCTDIRGGSATSHDRCFFLVVEQSLPPVNSWQRRGDREERCSEDIRDNERVHGTL